MRNTFILYFLFSVSGFSQVLDVVNTTGGGKVLSVGELGNSTIAMCKDRFGNTYTTGYFIDTIRLDLTNPNSVLTTNFSINPWRATFLAKYDKNGVFKWAKSLGDKSYNEPSSIVANKYGEIIIGGTAQQELAFDTVSLYDGGLGTSVFQGYLVRFDSLGNYLSGRMFGPGYTAVQQLEIGPNGDLYCTGSFSFPSRFNNGFGRDTLIPNFGFNSAKQYCCKMDDRMNFKWVKKLETKNGGVGISQLFVDSMGGFIIAGNGTDSANLSFTNNAQMIYQEIDTVGNSTSFTYFAKYDSSGNFEFVRVINYSSTTIKDIKKDKYGEIWIAGETDSRTDFDPGPAVLTVVSPGSNSPWFIAHYDEKGNFKKVFGLTTSRNTIGNFIEFDESGSVTLGGIFQGIGDFDPGPASTILSVPNYLANQNYNIFLTKYSRTGNFLWARSISGTSFQNIFSIINDKDNKISIAGFYNGSADFNLFAGQVVKTSV